MNHSGQIDQKIDVQGNSSESPTKSGLSQAFTHPVNFRFRFLPLARKTDAGKAYESVRRVAPARTTTGTGSLSDVGVTGTVEDSHNPALMRAISHRGTDIPRRSERGKRSTNKRVMQIKEAKRKATIRHQTYTEYNRQHKIKKVYTWRYIIINRFPTPLNASACDIQSASCLSSF